MHGNIDIDMISTIHRGNDSYIGFVRKSNTPIIGENGKEKHFENLFSIRSDELKSVLPGLKAWLFMDSYFMVNSAFRPAFWKNKKTGLQDVERKEKNLRYLNMCYADIDVGRPKSNEQAQRLTFSEAIYRVSILTELGEILPPSIIARSGHGAYLCWLLRDAENPDQPPKAWPELQVIYKSINKAFGEKLKAVAWDKRAFDASRVLRVPGSYHGTARRTVVYNLQYDENGKLFIYTLEELANFLGMPIPEREPIINLRKISANLKRLKYRPTKDKGSKPKRKNGQIILNVLRAQDLLTLEQYHGGFPHGCRRRRLTVYAEFLRRFNTKEEALRAVNVMASNCHPPYPSESNDIPPKIIIENVYSGKKGSVRAWTNKKLCQELKITAELARELELVTIVPPKVKEERKNQPSERELKKRDRQDAILEILSTHYHASCREISRALKKNYDIDTHYTTVSRELPLLRQMILDSRRLTA
jgi:transposase